MMQTRELHPCEQPDAPGQADAMRRQPAVSTLSQSLEDVVEQARALVGAHHAVIRVAVDEHWSEVVAVMSFSDKYAAWRAAASATGAGVDALWCPVPRPMRMTQDELAIHPAWRVLRSGTKKRPPLRGWLAVPLLDRLGRNFGTIEISDKYAGEFDADDERRLLQFSRVVAYSLECSRPSAAACDSVAADPQHYSLPVVHAEIGGILLRGGDLRDALQECADALVRRFDIALLRIWVSQGDMLELKASAGLYTHLDGPHSRIPVGQLKIGLIAQTRQPHLVPDLAADPHIHDKDWIRRENLQAFAGYPLLDNDDMAGVIAVFDRKPLSPALLQALALLTHPLALFIKQHRADVAPVARPAPPRAADAAREHAVIVTNLDGTITDWNHGAEMLFGYARREAIGKGLKLLAPPERAGEDRDLLRKVGADESAVLPSTQRLRKDGAAVDVCLTACPNRGHAGKPVGAILVAHDIGAMRRLQQQLFIAQKMEVFGHLAGGVAHDFNNLLTVILGYSEILLRRFTADESAHDLIGEIRKAGQRAETLTRQLLAFSRKQVVEPEVVDLNVAVSDTEKMLRRLIGEDILLTVILAPSLKPVKIDPGQMQQVILNLAVNARDAMPSGGRLNILTDNVTLDETYARTHHTRAGAYVLLAIGDNGVGMSPDVQARIFEPLFTTKGPGKGTGLGLATVRGIVKNAGGHIDVESEFGRGATFKIFLPQVQDAPAMHKAHSGLHAIPRGSETILLAEDEDSVRALARQVLETCGYRVLEAANGEEAIRLYERHQAPIHLLVSDVVMPYLGGRALADHLSTLNPQLRVLFLSGYTADAAAAHGVTEADFAYLQKPFTIRGLAQKVRDVLDAAPR